MLWSVVLIYSSHSGQKKDVFVRFFDCGRSVDEVMAILNKYKQQNSTVILSDGTELGANSGGSLSYQEVSGLLSRALEALVTARADHIQKYGRNEAIPAASSELIDAILSDDLHGGRAYNDHVAFMESMNALILQQAEEMAESMKRRMEESMTQRVAAAESMEQRMLESMKQRVAESMKQRLAGESEKILDHPMPAKNEKITEQLRRPEQQSKMSLSKVSAQKESIADQVKSS
jgi:hypothetical protein